jgi:4-hydroxy-tetrahydrodipicolinate synthase
MKEALVLLGRQDGPAVIRPPLMKITEVEIARIAEAMGAAGIARDGATGLGAQALAAE